MKFTFKSNKMTGPFRSFHNFDVDIKLNGKEVGIISSEKPFTISFQVIKKDIAEDGNTNCSWKWITLKKKSNSLQEAKDFVNANIKTILSKYNLHFSEDYKK